MATDALLYRLTSEKEPDPLRPYNELRETAGGRDNQTFSSEHFWHGAPSQHDPVDSEHRRSVRRSSQQFMLHDPPAHTRMLRAMQPVFTGRDFRLWSQALAAARDAEGNPLPDGELLGSLAPFLTAGNDTTVNLLGNGMTTFLLDHPEALRAVLDDPGKIPAGLPAGKTDQASW